jgi:16S rRNA (cytidine1402-2'-O)-methyltransferase
MSEEPHGQVVFVATPIGNREDITRRAVQVLAAADVIACEDTRHSRPLLDHLGIHKPLVSLHEHNEARRSAELIERARNGETIALITDAGMPAISDPGYRLLQACLAAGVAYTVLPGPSAVLTALVGSGFPTHAFFFGGFLPIKKGKRRSALDAGLRAEHTTIYFESPHRLLSTLEILAELDPAAPACVARELTKKFETYHRASAAELLEHFRAHPPKGEIVFLLPAR